MLSLNVNHYGVVGGRPLVVLHGFPGSSVQGFIFREFVHEFGIEVYSPDRPGYGKSPPQSSRGFQHWSAMVQTFVERQNFSRFDVIGISGGGPFAVALAAQMPERVQRLGLICALAPFIGSQSFSKFQRRGLSFYRRAPTPLTHWMVEKFIAKAQPELRIKALTKILNGKDAAVLNSEQVRPLLLQSMNEAREQGARGVLNDLDHYCRDWRLDWSRIEAPTWIWHGDEDRLLNPKMASELHQRIPHARLKLWPGEGHYSLPILRAREILSDFYGA